MARLLNEKLDCTLTLGPLNVGHWILFHRIIVILTFFYLLTHTFSVFRYQAWPFQSNYNCFQIFKLKSENWKLSKTIVGRIGTCSLSKLLKWQRPISCQEQNFEISKDFIILVILRLWVNFMFYEWFCSIRYLVRLLLVVVSTNINLLILSHFIMFNQCSIRKVPFKRNIILKRLN